MSTIAEQAGLGAAWQAILHPKIRELQAPKLPHIDCDNCPMVEARGFAPLARCCNIYPEFPNFLLGEILAKQQAEGSPAKVEAWIDEGRSGPTFSHKPPVMHRRYDDANYDHIGDIPPCPLLGQDGRCTVYHQRPSTCIEYNCTYPPFAEIIAFWHGYHSLLALYSATTAGYLLGILGIDLEAFHETWGREDEASIWGDGVVMRADFHEQLWQGKKPRAFYKACYEHVIEHGEGLHDELEFYRREQVFAQIKDDGTWSQVREDELLQRPLAASIIEPPGDLWNYLASGQHLAPEENPLTLIEWVGIVLWLHQSMMGRYTALLKAQGEAAEGE